MTSLAVVMATFEGARFVSRQLESIAGQTRPPDLLVVSDDGSTDGTRDLVEAFARSAPFAARVIDGPRSGLADNFWQAAQHAGCDLIAWADQDDAWSPRKLELCEAALAHTGAAFVSHSADVTGRHLQPTGARYPDYAADTTRSPLEGDPWHVPSGFASVFRRELLHGVDWDHRPPSHQTSRPMNHDHAVSLRAFAGRRVELAASLARYRQHDGNAAGDPSDRGLDVLRTALRVGGRQFADLAGYAEAYGRWTRGLVAEPAAIDAYFGALAERCRRRAALYDGAAGHVGRLRRLADATRRGDYGPKARGGFGRLAGCKDLAAIAVSLGPQRTAA